MDKQKQKQQQEQQEHRNEVEEKIFGKEIAQSRREVEKLYSAAMDKVSTLVDAKKADIKRPKMETMVNNLKAYAASNADKFWDKVQAEIKFAGAVGIQDLFGLSQANTILDESFQNAIKKLHEYGMTISAPLTILGTKIFYHINEGNDVEMLMQQLRTWEPEGWQEFEQKNKENK